MIPLLLAQALNVSIVAGGLSSLSSQDSFNITPTASLEISGHIADENVYNHLPRLAVNVDLSSLPEEEIRLDDPASFKTIEFRIGLVQPIPGIFPKVFAGFGFASRLPGETEPRIKVAQYLSAGIRFATDDDTSYIEIGGGPDQRLNTFGYYEGCGHIAGQVKLATYRDAKLFLKGNAILGSTSSLVRIGIVVGI